MRKKLKNKKVNGIAVKIILIALAMLLLAFMDFILIEKVYKPISAENNIPWEKFLMQGFLGQTGMTWWHFSFFILAFSIFILLGVAFKDWKFSAAGIILFVSGWEDILYFAIQLQWLPSELAWLNYSPIMGLSRFITGTENVISWGIIITAILSFIIALFIYKFDFKKRKFIS